jgi:hypothetical protein
VVDHYQHFKGSCCLHLQEKSAVLTWRWRHQIISNDVLGYFVLYTRRQQSWHSLPRELRDFALSSCVRRRMIVLVIVRLHRQIEMGKTLWGGIPSWVQWS